LFSVFVPLTIELTFEIQVANVFVWMPEPTRTTGREVAFVVTATIHANELSNLFFQATRYNIAVQVVPVLIYYTHLEKCHHDTDEATDEHEGKNCGNNFHANNVIISQRKVKGRRSAPCVVT